jgi:nicotinamide mononucleotide (NMN) deamidase PncC
VTFPIDLDTLVRRIHAAPVGIVLAITGGGSRAVAELLERPGGSRVLVEAIVPYSAAALVDFLATTPEQFCSARTARLMAMAAYQRALRLASAGPESADLDALQKDSAIVGIACTASLASDRPKRGDHRVHVAYQTQGTTAEYSLVLTKDRRNRIEEENVATSLILNALSHACGKLGELNLDTVESIDERRAEADEAQQELLHGGRRQVQVGRVPIIATGQRRAVFPGAFNPLHDGHREMARIARERLGQPVEFEISIHNVDKPPLDYLEMRDRVEQFKDGETLWLTRAPTFEEKSRIFPDATFIVGADTITRIADPVYYDGNQQAMLAAIDRIASRGGRFLVFGRSGDSVHGFQALETLDLPSALLAICTEVSESEFRADVSSTQLRRDQSNLNR